MPESNSQRKQSIHTDLVIRKYKVIESSQTREQWERKVTRILGSNWIKELEDRDGDGDGELEIGVSNKGHGGGSSSIGRALAKNTVESGARGYCHSLHIPSFRIKSSSLWTQKCMKTRKRTIRCPSKSLPSHSPTISNEFAATQHKTSNGPSKSSLEHRTMDLKANKECDEKGVRALEQKECPSMVHPCKAEKIAD